MVDEKRKDELERRIGDHQLTQLQHLITLSDSYQKAKNGIRQEVALSDKKKRYQTSTRVIRHIKMESDSHQTTSSAVCQTREFKLKDSRFFRNVKLHVVFRQKHMCNTCDMCAKAKLQHNARVKTNLGVVDWSENKLGLLKDTEAVLIHQSEKLNVYGIVI